MKIVICESFDQFFPGKVSEDMSGKDDRYQLDANILATLAANTAVNALEIGTGRGYSTVRIAENIPGVVRTVNALANQMKGEHTTMALSATEIGSYYRERGIENVRQYYADSMNWPHPVFPDIKLCFIDGCHDADYVEHDTLLCLDQLQPGGIIVWHDFLPEGGANWNESVREGIRRAMGKDDLVWHVEGSLIGFCWPKEK